MQPPQAREILQALFTLPPERVTEVYDFILFLQTRYRLEQPVDVGESWSEEDISDLMSASLAYAAHTFWDGEKAHDSAR